MNTIIKTLRSAFVKIGELPQWHDVGVVDDFDGTLQHLNLEAGPHQIEILMVIPRSRSL